MRRWLISLPAALCLAVVIAPSVTAQALDPTDDDLNACIEVETQIGANCRPSAHSVAARFTNKCLYPVDLHYCIDRREGEPTCRVARGLETNASRGNYVCTGTGQVRHYACPVGSRCAWTPPGWVTLATCGEGEDDPCPWENDGSNERGYFWENWFD